jgi:MFS family permease
VRTDVVRRFRAGTIAPMRNNWVPIAILAAAQFVMVLDSSVMNVSISQIVADLDTTIQGVQLAITCYTLVMAAFMLVGAKLGDIWGRNRAFAVGLVVYATGSFITAISPNLPVLLFGWSLIEGLGAVLVIPAIAALIAQNYEGPDRALAYGLVGGVAAAAIAVGPVIGGFVTSAFTWRLVFLGEVVIVAVILLVRNRMRSAPRDANPPSLDIVGAVLSASGLAIIVLAILQSSTWGFIVPRSGPTINGQEIAPLGFSVVPFLILIGLGVLYLFEAWENRLERLGRDRLLDLALLRIVPLRAGLSTLAIQQLLILGTFFVLPVYLQVVLGFNAFETGLRLVPMSVAMLIAALSGPRLAVRRSPRAVARLGLVAVALGAVIVLATLDVELNALGFGVGLAVFGIGAGLLASQLGNVIISSAPPAQTNEAGGLQGTAQNLGASLGTALIGAVLLLGLTSGFANRIEEDEALPVDMRTALADKAREVGLEVVTLDQVAKIATDAGLPPDQVAAVTADYGDAQLQALRLSIGAVALFALLGLVFTRNLPAGSTAVVEALPREPAPAAASAG